MFEKIFADIIPPDLKNTGSDIMVNCPFHNDSNASFSISTNPDRPVYHCFGCGKKGSWVGYFMEKNNLSYPEAMNQLGNPQFKPASYQGRSAVKTEKPVVDYSEDVFAAWNNIFDNYKIHCKNLWELTGLTLSTAIPCMIGFGAPSFIPKEAHWIFPVFRYPDFMCVGYEVRHKEFKKDVFINKRSGKPAKVIKAPNTPSCLCFIYKPPYNESKRCIITEGFKDGYFMFQYLSEKNTKELPSVKDTIISPSCGVTHLPELLRENKLEEFEEILIVLDNDEGGNAVKEQLKGVDSRFKFFSQLNEGEDFEEYYKRVLRK